MTDAYRTAGLTTIALIAFAANSIFCRFALGDQTIDATSFATSQPHALQPCSWP